jgi:copper(I)-binding protein
VVAATPSTVTATTAWARSAPAGADGAVYLVVRNTTRDTVVLVGAATPAARAASLHESMTMGAGAAAMMHMAPLPRAAVPPGDSLVLAPGGRHLMLEGLVRALAPGDRIPLVLRLASGDSVLATADVRAP